MIEPTPSLIAARPGSPPRPIEARDGSDVRAGSAPGARKGAPDAGQDSPQPFDDLIATAERKASPPPRPGKAPVSRQILAASGTPLPDDAAPAAVPPLAGLHPGESGGEDSPADAAKDDGALPEPRLEPALAWLIPPPPPPAAPFAGATIRGGSDAAAPDEAQLVAAPPVAAQENGVEAPGPDVSPPDGKVPVSRPLTATPDPSAAKPPIQRLWRPEPPVKSAPAALAPGAVPPPAVRPIAVVTITDIAPQPGPAATDVALATAVAAGAATAARRDDDDPLPQALPAAAASAGPQAAAVAATGGAQQAGIDLTRDPGLHRMIDRIEALRDAADARDTRIRLIPDALGPVDVSVRRDGESIHVHFTASEAMTRQLIADAQSRLTELADARGVRIDRATVDGGTAGQHGQAADHSARHPQRATTAGPNHVPADVAPDAAPDQRIA